MKITYILLGVLALIIIAACTPPEPNIILDPDPCAELNNSDGCYFDLAQENQTISCPFIVNERFKSVCYVEVVKFDPQEKYCDLVEEQDEKYCYAELGIALADYSICDKSADLSKDYCYEKVAEQKNDKDMCAQLPSRVWKDTCFKYFGEQLMDKIFCFNIKSEGMRDNCVYNVSIESNDPKLCHSIVNTQPSSLFNPKRTTPDCIYELVKINEDITICDEMEDSFMVQVCRGRIAINLGRVELCEKVSIKQIRERCVEVIMNPPEDEERIEETTDSNSTSTTEITPETDNTNLTNTEINATN